MTDIRKRVSVGFESTFCFRTKEKSFYLPIEVGTGEGTQGISVRTYELYK